VPRANDARSVLILHRKEESNNPACVSRNVGRIHARLTVCATVPERAMSTCLCVTHYSFWLIAGLIAACWSTVRLSIWSGVDPLICRGISASI